MVIMYRMDEDVDLIIEEAMVAIETTVGVTKIKMVDKSMDINM